MQKLARVMPLLPGLKLYRGLGGTVSLPRYFYKTDAQGCRGFAEWGFMSTTADREVRAALRRPTISLAACEPRPLDGYGGAGASNVQNAGCPAWPVRWVGSLRFPHLIRMEHLSTANVCVARRWRFDTLGWRRAKRCRLFWRCERELWTAGRACATSRSTWTRWSTSGSPDPSWNRSRAHLPTAAAPPSLREACGYLRPREQVSRFWSA